MGRLLPRAEDVPQHVHVAFVADLDRIHVGSESLLLGPFQVAEGDPGQLVIEFDEADRLYRGSASPSPPLSFGGRPPLARMVRNRFTFGDSSEMPVRQT